MNDLSLSGILQATNAEHDAALMAAKEDAATGWREYHTEAARVRIILNSLKLALKIVLDEAEARNYEPPANCELVAELEYAIAKATA